MLISGCFAGFDFVGVFLEANHSELFAGYLKSFGIIL
jgi:hypothetical protein